MHRVHLEPLGATVDVAANQDLADVLFPYGVEFPCGGTGRCRGCRVRVVKGEVAVTPEMRRAFSEAELAAGWRLACRARIGCDVTLEVAQWETALLVDASTLPVVPRVGYGVAVDVGTTTLAAQLLDLQTGDVLAVQTALNPQAAYGADVMTRIEYASGNPEQLGEVVRARIGKLIAGMVEGLDWERVVGVLLCGNTVMHHLFGALDVTPLAAAPFAPTQLGALRYQAAQLGWPLAPHCEVEFLPCLGGFVGSDILAGIIALDMDIDDGKRALVDLGTNGEIVVAERGQVVCASTAAGPAFEAGRIRMGMRAAVGAIDQVRYRRGRYHCHVIGGAAPRGICGSGLTAAAAAALDAGDLLPSGRLRAGLDAIDLKGGVSLYQGDIRQLQLAKAAIAAGLRILSAPEQTGEMYLAGAFGNYLDAGASVRIGLTPVDAARLHAAGNTALRGTKAILLSGEAGRERVEKVTARARHVSLNDHEQFQDIFVEQMRFPD